MGYELLTILENSQTAVDYCILQPTKIKCKYIEVSQYVNTLFNVEVMTNSTCASSVDFFGYTRTKTFNRTRNDVTEMEMQAKY